MDWFSYGAYNVHKPTWNKYGLRHRLAWKYFFDLKECVPGQNVLGFKGFRTEDFKHNVLICFVISDYNGMSLRLRKW